MLIECSECKKQISDKAKCCPYCGCPIEVMNMDYYCSINGIKYNLSELMDILPTVGDRDTDTHPLHLVGIIRDKTSLDWDSAKKLVDIIIETKKIPGEFNGKVEIKTESKALHCPFCNSTNVHKISGTERAVSVIGLGLFSKKINKSFKCKNCGGTF